MLAINDLTVEFDTPDGVLRAVDNVSYSVGSGEVVGVVGESGSGKSITAEAILGLVPTPPARVVSGSALYGGADLLRLSQRELRRIRGREIGLVAQDPMAALNPLLTIGQQVLEAVKEHNPGISSKAATRRAIDLLESVHVPDPAARLRAYPHQLSGGMAQRVVIAMAIANHPRLLIADEPTTALDVTVQAQVLRTLRQAQRATGAAMILISHDLAVIAELAHRVVVMYAGRVVESGDVSSLFKTPAHPYTAGLLASIPRLDQPRARLRPIRGQPPELSFLERGCAFAPRCALSGGRADCAVDRPEQHQFAPGRTAACHFFEEMIGRTQ